MGETLYIQYHVTVNPTQICVMQYFSTDTQDLLLLLFKIKQKHDNYRNKEYFPKSGKGCSSGAKQLILKKPQIH